MGTTGTTPTRLGTAALLLLSLAPCTALAQSATLDSVNRYVEAERVRQQVPAFSVAVLRGDSLVLARGYGYANVEHRVPATDSTVYQSGSVGKQFTSAAIMLLVEAGRIRLDDTLTRYFPEGPAWWHGITIRHLLSHTSGIPDYADSTLDMRRDYTEDDLVRLAGNLKPLFAPGERWSYSNTAYVLLGILIHRVTGAFYGDFLAERIFRPLGMATHVISEADIVPHRAAGYRLVGDTLRNQEWVSPTLNTTADGSLYFTVLDLARWAMNLNHPRVPSAASLAASWTPIRLNDGGTYPYGFGWAVDQQRGYRRIGHGGSWQGFRTSIQRYPDFDLTVIVLANLAQARPDAVAQAIAGILEPTLVPPHLLTTPLPGPGPKVPIPDAMRRIFVDRDSTLLTPGFARFLLPDLDGSGGAMLAQIRDWAPLGCDVLGPKRFERLGATVERVCYARGSTPRGGVLFQVLYTGDWHVAETEPYLF